jgi:hypothetical protein
MLGYAPNRLCAAPAAPLPASVPLPAAAEPSGAAAIAHLGPTGDVLRAQPAAAAVSNIPAAAAAAAAARPLADAQHALAPLPEQVLYSEALLAAPEPSEVVRYEVHGLGRGGGGAAQPARQSCGVRGAAAVREKGTPGGGAVWSACRCARSARGVGGAGRNAGGPGHPSPAPLLPGSPGSAR